MATFPSSIPSYLGFTAGHTLLADQHGSQHNSEQGDIIALATKLGTGASTPATSTVLTSTSNGTSSWSQVNLTTMVSGVLPVANGGTGTTNTTGTGSVVFATAPSLSAPVITGGGSWAGSPTISTPTIADFTNSQHSHANAAGGGQLNATNALQNSTVTADKLNLGPQTAVTATTETTVSTTYADLSGGATGPSVTVTIGANGLALVDVGGGMSNTIANNGNYMGFAISGATTVAASDTFSSSNRTAIANFGTYHGRMFLVTGLNPGSTTFTAKYRTEANTATIADRRIVVVPL